MLLRIANPLWSLLASLFLLAGCAQLPTQVDRPASTALATQDSTTLGRLVKNSAPTATISGFRLIFAGGDALDDRIALIDRAEKTIDLQYYIIESDASVRQIAEHLLAAADRGVRVRILLDDFHTVGTDAAIVRFAQHRNVQIRLFNPFPGGRGSTIGRFLTSFQDIPRLNRRMHNKLFIVDNALCIAGGRNLGDGYFVRSPESNFVDLDVLAAGPIVRRLSHAFDRYWNSELAYPAQSIIKIPPEEIGPPTVQASGPKLDPQDSGLAAELRGPKLSLEWAPATVLVDNPDKISDDGPPDPDDIIIDNVATLLKSGQKDILLVSPYFVPGEQGMALMKDERSRGVNVRVVTNSLASTDAPVVHIGYSKYRPMMLAEGVDVYEMEPAVGEESGRSVRGSGSGSGSMSGFGSSRASLHAKVIAIDGTMVFIGSMNLDQRSAYENTEIGIVIKSPVLAQQVADNYAGGLIKNSWHVTLDDHGQLQWTQTRDGKEEVYTSEPEAKLLLRLQLWLMGPFAPEEML